MTPIRQILIVSLMTFLCGGSSFAEGFTVSPYKIQQYIAAGNSSELSPIWRELGIPAELSTVYPRVGIEPDDHAIFDECEDCRAEIHPLAWKNRKDRLVALKIYQPWGSCRFLIFQRIDKAKSKETPWRLIGYADHDFARYDMPEHRTETLGNATYFVMTAQGFSGTGVSLYYERWYELFSDGMKEVLSLPSRGHECPGPTTLCRNFSARVEKAKSNNLRIRILYKAQYTGYRFLLDGQSFEDIYLFATRKNAVYVRDKAGNDFTLSTFESEMTAEEIRLTYGINGLTCEDFLRFNGAPIKRLTAQPDDRKSWLKRYFQECEPSADGKKLMEALTK